jgi:hypothetical protein
MGVSTVLRRVSPELLKSLRSDPELVERLLYEGEVDGVTPPSIEVDKAWDDNLYLLRRTGSQAAREALDVELADVEGLDVAFCTADMVRSGAIVLKDLRIDELREPALRDEELRTYCADGTHSGDTDPIGYEHMIDYVLDLLGTVVDFWREAAAAKEAILSETS